MRNLGLITCALLAFTGCKAGLSLVGGSKGSSGAPRGGGPVSSGGGGGEPSVPDVPPIVAGQAPPWCGSDYQKSTNDSNLGWAKSELENNGWTLKGLRYMARAACDKATDEQRQGQVQTWKTEFMKAFQASEKDFVLAMNLTVEEKVWKGLEEEQCKKYKSAIDEEPNASKRAQIRVEGYLVDCVRELTESDRYWLDLDKVTMTQQLALAAQCLGTRDEETVSGEFAYCGHDLTGLDRAKLDKEAAELNLNMFGRVALTMKFGSIKTRADATMKKVTELAKKDDNYQTLLDAHDKAWKAWQASYKENAAIFDAVRQFDDKAGSGSKKAVAGCGGELRKLFFGRMEQGRVKTKEKAIAFATDPVGFPLLLAMMRCDAMEDRFFEAATAHSVYFSKAANAYRGPRSAAFYATLKALNDIRADRASFKLDRLQPQAPDVANQLATTAYEMTFNKIDYGNATGKVNKVTRKGDNVNVSFKTVRWKEPTYKCRTTNRLARITDDGQLQYEEICKVTGSVNRSSTESPVVVPADFAHGLKPGQMVVMSLNTKDGKRVAIPVEVYADDKMKKFIGFFGLVW
jgi:hypothetical protein